MIFTSSSDNSRSVGILCSLFFLLCVYLIGRNVSRHPARRLPAYLLNYVVSEDDTDVYSTEDIQTLKEKLENMNWQRNTTNWDKYLAVDDDTPILLVQVHKDVRRLQYLVASLALVRDVNTALLIFSHSFYRESINRLVESIDFCKVMQIFYPHSVQLNPHKFPGVDRDDCAPGRAGPGAPCAARDAAVAEHKQHWWWKAHWVFHRSDWARTHRAPVIFLEENNYVVPDLLHMLQYMRRSFAYFPRVEVISFGRPLTKNVDMSLLTLEPWRPPFDVGLAFNKTTWIKILSFSAQFCMYDDFSWSYSLFNLFENFLGGFVNMVACVTPRIVPIQEITDTIKVLNTYSEPLLSTELFPEKVKAVQLFGRYGPVAGAVETPAAGSGGWSDLRDQVLCLDPLFSTTSEEKRYDDAEVTRN